MLINNVDCSDKQTIVDEFNKLSTYWPHISYNSSKNQFKKNGVTSLTPFRQKGAVIHWRDTQSGVLPIK